jgi:hypothetical protein
MTAIFSEEFEIVICTHDDYTRYDREEGVYRPEYLEEITKALAEIGISRDQFEHHKSGVGVGASADAIAIIVTGILFAGKKIEENIDAWINLAKKLKGVLAKLKMRGNNEQVPLYISEPVAAGLAIGDILKAVPGAKRIALESTRIEQVPNPSIGPQVRGIFRYDQMRYYVFSFRVLNRWETVHLIGIRSTGDMEFHHTLHITNWMGFCGFDSGDPDS